MVLLRSEVKEWILPAPLTVSGEAGVSFSCIPDVLVSGVASAVSAVAGYLPVSGVFLSGASEFACTGGVSLFPALVGDASPVLDGTGSTVRNVAARNAGAELPISGLSPIAVSGLSSAGVIVVPGGDAAVPQSGSASVTFEYYGTGDTPIFPFYLPFLLLPEGFDNSDAAAFVDVEGFVAPVVDTSGVAEVPGFDASGLFVLLGSIPIFPFQLPGAFDSLGAKNRGVAEVLVVGAGETVSECGGDAVVNVGGFSTYVSGCLLPFNFPVLFS